MSAVTLLGGLTNADLRVGANYVGGVAPVDGDTITIPTDSTVLITYATAWFGTGAQAANSDVFTNNGRVIIDPTAGGQLRLKGRLSCTGTTSNLGQIVVQNGSTTASAIKIDTGVGIVYQFRIGTGSSNTNCARLILDNSANYDTPANHWYLFEVIGTGSIWFNRASNGCGQMDLQGCYSTGKIDNGTGSAFEIGSLSTMTTQFVWRQKGVRWGSCSATIVSQPPNGRDVIHYELVHRGTLVGTVSWNGTLTSTGNAIDAAAGGVRRIVDSAFEGSFTMRHLRDFTFGETGKPLYFHSEPLLPATGFTANDAAAGAADFAVRALGTTGIGYIGDTQNLTYIVFAPSQSSPLGNPHLVVEPGVRDNLHDGFIMDGTWTNGTGDCFSGIAGTTTTTLKNGIVNVDLGGKPVGTIFSIANSGANVARFSGDHCTYPSIGSQGSACWGETAAGKAGQVPSWTNMLVFTGTTATTGGVVLLDQTPSSTNEAGVVTHADYNAIERVLGTGVLDGDLRVGSLGIGQYEQDSAGSYAETPPGTHDVLLGDLGAKFELRGANMHTWYRSVQGGLDPAELADDFAAGFTNWLKRGLATYDATLSIGAYRTYMRNKFRPRTLTLWNNPGSDGATRGAVQMQQPPTIGSEDATDPVAFSATAGGGNPATQTIHIRNIGEFGSLDNLSLSAITYDSGAAWLTTRTLGALSGGAYPLTLGVTTGAQSAGTYDAHFFVLSDNVDCVNGVSGYRVNVRFTVGAGGSTITAVDVTPEPVTLIVGQTQAMSAAVTGTGGFSTAASWTTDDPSVATIAGTGDHTALLTAVGVGTCTITGKSTQDPTRTDPVSVTVNPVPDPVITADTSGLGSTTWALLFGAGTPAPIAVPLTNGSATPVTGLTASLVSWGAGEPQDWLSVTLGSTTIGAGTNLNLIPAAGIGAGLYGPRHYSVTVRLSAPDADDVDIPLSLWIVPVGSQAIFPPIVTARRVDDTVIAGAIISYSVDRDDIVACQADTGICFVPDPVLTEQTVTPTATSGGKTLTLRTFKVYPNGIAP